MLDEATLPNEQAMRISERAVKRIAALVAQEHNDALMLRITVSGGGCSGFQYGFSLDDQRNDALMLRITVSGGGCSGFQYGFSLDDQRNDDDRLFERDGVGIVVDDVSLDLLKGSEVDFVEDLIGSYFAIKNPNASSTCGCGSSFSI